jgi:Family of unknown function (DUF6318)
MRGFVAAAVVIAVTALAGCTDEPTPRFEEPTRTPSASDSTSSAAAEREPWEEKSKAGAVAFARHWVDLLNEAQVTGQVARLRATSTSQCVTCQDLAEQLESLYAKGGRVETDGWNVLLVGPPQGVAGGSAEVTIRVARAPQRVYDGDGPPERFVADRSTFSAGLVWKNEQWLMDELVRFT